MKRHFIFTLAVLISFAYSTCIWGANKNKEQNSIKAVEAVEITCVEGCVPRLPYIVLVNYDDGHQAWRQVRWMNDAIAIEHEQADKSKHPAGSSYTVRGFILGEGSTDYGYPIQAKVKVVKQAASVPTQAIAKPLPLKDVKLMGENRLTNNRKHDVDNLLAINYKQMLYNYRDTYSLSTAGYPVSDGWDSPTTKLKGHGTGHYLSALAFAYASETDNGRKTELMSRIRAMVDEMRICQERTFVYDKKLGRYREARDYAPEAELLKMKGNWTAFNVYKKDYKNYGYGYLNAIPAAHPALIECYRAYNNEEWVWAPYYTIHKQLAGLIDIAQNVDDKAVAEKALLIAKDMGLWVWNRLHYRTYVKTDGTKQERQARPGNRYEMWNMYIAGEVGGMQESLARLSEMVNDKTEKEHLLEAATYFDAPAFFDPLSRNIDDARTRHANQHIPMITGALQTYLVGGNHKYYDVANNFWNIMMGRYVYATGGVGNGEMWRQPYTQILSMNTNTMRDNRGQIHANPTLNETCCAYNLAKLTKELNTLAPDNAMYMDYYERVLMNQLVGSVHPDRHACTYQYAVGMNGAKPYGNETPQSSCCGGTGAENHVKYQEATYFVSDNTIWITQYMPTEAYWNEKDVYITQDCKWPAERIKITVRPNKNGTTSRFAMKIRIPYWSTSFSQYISLNGKTIGSGNPDNKKVTRMTPCSYFEIPEREWKNGDELTIQLHYGTHINYGPDKMEVAAVDGDPSKKFSPAWVGAIMYGPLVMATENIKSWDEAEFNMNKSLNNVERYTNGNDETDGTGGPLYSLTLRNITRTPNHWDQAAPQTAILTPDYYQTNASTHYLRIHYLASGKNKVDTKLQTQVMQEMLQATLQTALQRIGEQQAWNAMITKTPWHAPWASNGFERMQKEMEHAKEIVSKKADASTLRTTLSSLNAALNSMRPGNLAEPEDLSELQTLLSAAKNNKKPTAEQKEAIKNAEMVVKYVNDGSGTHDMIQKAVQRLR